MSGAGARADLFITSTGSYSAPITNNTGGLRDGWATTNDYAGTLGHAFTVGNSDLTVTSLAYYDGPNSALANASGYTADGLNNAHSVGIWDSSGTLVASALIPAGVSTAINDFQFVPLGSSVTLLANQVYVLGGQVTVADNTPGGIDEVRRDEAMVKWRGEKGCSGYPNVFRDFEPIFA